MVYKIFKNIMPCINHKNVNLDLLKHYITLYAMCHLFDGGIDNYLSSMNNTLNNLSHHLKQLINGWFIADKSLDFNNNHRSEGRFILIN